MKYLKYKSVKTYIMLLIIIFVGIFVFYTCYNYCIIYNDEKLIINIMENYKSEIKTQDELYLKIINDVNNYVSNEEQINKTDIKYSNEWNSKKDKFIVDVNLLTEKYPELKKDESFITNKNKFIEIEKDIYKDIENFTKLNKDYINHKEQTLTNIIMQKNGHNQEFGFFLYLPD